MPRKEQSAILKSNKRYQASLKPNVELKSMQLSDLLPIPALKIIRMSCPPFIPLLNWYLNSYSLGYSLKLIGYCMRRIMSNKSLSASPPIRIRKCVNHVTFFKNYVIYILSLLYKFIPQFIDKKGIIGII